MEPSSKNMPPYGSRNWNFEDFVILWMDWLINNQIALEFCGTVSI
jgi:hypothetical protein